MEHVYKLLNIGQATESACKKCWNLRHCSMCAGQLEFETEPTYEEKIKKCKSCNNNTLFDLRELCVLSEFGLDAEEMRLI